LGSTAAAAEGAGEEGRDEGEGEGEEDDEGLLLPEEMEEKGTYDREKDEYWSISKRDGARGPSLSSSSLACCSVCCSDGEEEEAASSVLCCEPCCSRRAYPLLLFFLLSLPPYCWTMVGGWLGAAAGLLGRGEEGGRGVKEGSETREKREEEKREERMREGQGLAAFYRLLFVGDKNRPFRWRKTKEVKRGHPMEQNTLRRKEKKNKQNECTGTRATGEKRRTTPNKVRKQGEIETDDPKVMKQQ